MPSDRGEIALAGNAAIIMVVTGGRIHIQLER